MSTAVGWSWPMGDKLSREIENPLYYDSIVIAYCYFEAPVGYPDRAGRRLSGACSFFLGLPSFIYSWFGKEERGCHIFFGCVVFYIIRG